MCGAGWQDKVCGEAKYRDLFPMNVFDPKARGWRKVSCVSSVGRQRERESGAVVC